MCCNRTDPVTVDLFSTCRKKNKARGAYAVIGPWYEGAKAGAKVTKVWYSSQYIVGNVTCMVTFLWYASEYIAHHKNSQKSGSCLGATGRICFFFLIRIRSSHSRVQGGLWAVSSVRKDCLERCQSSEDGTSTFVTLVHWVDGTLVCKELLLLSRQLSPSHGFLFHE